MTFANDCIMNTHKNLVTVLTSKLFQPASHQSPFFRASTRSLAALFSRISIRVIFSPLSDRGLTQCVISVMASVRVMMGPSRGAWNEPRNQPLFRCKLHRDWNHLIFCLHRPFGYILCLLRVYGLFMQGFLFLVLIFSKGSKLCIQQFGSRLHWKTLPLKIRFRGMQLLMHHELWFWCT